jgi:hypothetical protein
MYYADNCIESCSTGYVYLREHDLLIVQQELDSYHIGNRPRIVNYLSLMTVHFSRISSPLPYDTLTDT